MNWTERLGALGMWMRGGDITPSFAADLERWGYGTIWLGSSPPADLEHAETLLDATESVVVATGIVNIWKSDAAELADAYHRIVAKHPGRLVLGIGTGHREATPHRARPLQAMSDYLDVLDERGVPIDDRVLSALGPRMMAIADERSGGTHPYLTVPAQSREAREALGEGKLVAPEQTVVLDADVESARRSARAFLRNYLRLVNYTGNMLRAGFTEADIAGDGSDELIDRIVVHGAVDDLVAAVRAHLDAGADHVWVQVQPTADAPRALREIAEAFPS
jgi:probable F420-dependent oxidoreductase